MPIEFSICPSVGSFRNQSSEIRPLGQGNLEGKVGVRSSGPQSGVAERAPALYLSVSVSREGALVGVPGLQGAWYPLIKA